MKNHYKISNLQAMETFAQELAGFVELQKTPFFVLLKGGLGAGKTMLTKLVLKKLVPEAVVTSPTFVILNTYEAPGKIINHMDAYRLTTGEDLELYLESLNQGLNFIEWPQNLGWDWNNVDHLTLTITSQGGESREIIVE